MPEASAPEPVRLPAIERSTLANGVRVWTLPYRALPVVSIAVLIDAGSASDPIDQPGLHGLMADLIDEGAGGRNAIGLAEALGDLGASLETTAGADTIFGGGVIMNRSARMPAFGESLNTVQIRALVRYIRTLCHCEGPQWSRDGTS